MSLLHKHVRNALLAVAMLAITGHGVHAAADRLKDATTKINALLNAGAYQDAANLGAQALLKAHPFDPDLPGLLHAAGLAKLNTGDPAGAEIMFARAYRILEQTTIGPSAGKILALDWRGGVFFQLGNFQQAEKMSRLALIQRMRLYPPQHGELAIGLNMLGNALARQNRFPEARETFLKALAIQKARQIPSDLAFALNQACYSYHSDGQAAAAEPYCREAVTTREMGLAGDSSGLAFSLNELAYTLFSQSRFQEAEPLYRKAVALREKAGSDGDLIFAIEQLANVLVKQGRDSDADEHFRRLADLTIKTKGADSIDVAGRLNELGNSLYRQGKFGDAVPVYERALAIALKALGPDDPDIAFRLSQLGSTFQKQGSFANAESAYRRALAIRRHTDGKDRSQVAFILNELAFALMQQQKASEAEPLYREVLDIRKANHPLQSQEVIFATKELATCLSQLKRYLEAEQLYRTALASQEALTGIDSLPVAEDLNFVARALVNQRRFQDADGLFHRLLAIRESKQSADHPDKAQALGEYGNNLLELNRLDEAEKAFRTALKIRAQHSGPVSDEVRDTTNSLVTTLKRLKRYDDAESLLAQAVVDAGIDRTPERTNLRSLMADLAKLQMEREEFPAAAETFRSLVQTCEQLFGASDGRTLSALYKLAGALRSLNRYDDTVSVYRRIVEILEADKKSDSLDMAFALHELGLNLYDNNRFKEALDVVRPALEIRRKRLKADDQAITYTMGVLAASLAALGDQDAGEALLKAGIEQLDRKSEKYDERLIEKLADLSTFYNRLNRYRDAERALTQAASIAEAMPEKPHNTVTTIREGLGRTFYLQGRYADAEREYDKALSNALSTPNKSDLRIANIYSDLGVVFNAMGKYADAERAGRRALAVREAATGPDSLEVTISLNNLGSLYSLNGLESEAEAFMRRALAIKEKSLQPNHPDIALGIVNLASLKSDQGKDADVEILLRRALSINEVNFGPDSPEVIYVKKQFADLYARTGRQSEAEGLYQSVIRGYRKTLGKDHPDVADAEVAFADYFVELDRYDEARSYYQDAYRIFLLTYGQEHRSTARALNGIGAVFVSERNWKKALESYALATLEYLKRRDGGAGAERAQLADQSTVKANSAVGSFRAVAKMAYQLYLAADKDEDWIARSFENAQWASQTDAAASLTKMSSRLATGNDRLALLIRARQDGEARWNALDKILLEKMNQEGAARDMKAERTLRTELADISNKIGEVNDILAKEFPNYTAFANPKPLNIADVQAQLGPDEVMLFFLDTRKRQPLPAESFVWGVTREKVVWYRLPLSEDGLSKSVSDLRQALGVGSVSRSAVSLLTSDDGSYDLKLAHDLYKALFGQIEDLIAGKRLIIVPSRSLAALPFQVLVTSLPAGSDMSDDRYRRANWLIKNHAISILPSVGALKVLRDLPDRTQGGLPYLGIGNPLLTGADGKDRRAWSSLDCKLDGARIVKNSTDRPQTIKLSALYRGPEVNLTELRQLAPLPETRDELCDTAASMGVGEEALLMGPRATEGNINSMNSSGKLAQYRVLHFATHGLVAGDFTGLMEPAIVMSPPENAVENDNGLLTASEISALKLNADWVILSACNTAAGAAGKTEALSGLANAFFYAGAQSLMVTHWAVDSEAAVELTTQTFKRLANEPSMGRAEALRQSMMSVIDRGGAAAHPSYWAPFILVGDR